MDMINFSDKISLFTFNNKQILVWPFLGEYQEKILEWLQINKFNQMQFHRFMLISLLPDYRAATHHAETLTTDCKNRNIKNKQTEQKFNKFNEFFGKTITNTIDYLNCLKINNLNDLNAENIFNFVIYDTPISKN